MEFPRTDFSTTQNLPAEVSELGQFRGRRGAGSCLAFSFGNCSSGLFTWYQGLMPAPSNGCSDNYMDFKLFTTLCPQSNFRINLGFDKELVAALQSWSDVRGLLSACYNSGGRPCAPGEHGRCSLCNLGEKNQSINQFEHT